MGLWNPELHRVGWPPVKFPFCFSGLEALSGVRPESPERLSRNLGIVARDLKTYDDKSISWEGVQKD